MPYPLDRSVAASVPVLALENFTVSVRTGAHALAIVQDLDISIARGETLGIVGESGCGKSITWLAALRLAGDKVATSGRVLLHGQDITQLSERSLARIRGGKIGMVFQDPTSSLDPVQRIGRQIGESLKLHQGLSGSAARAEAERLLDRVGIADAQARLDQYPHELSGGMNQRVMIAIALAGQPDILVADEPTTALDATVQAQILDLLRDIGRDTGMGLVLISHDLGVIADMCERVAVMYAGRLVETGPATALLAMPRHPYTRGLIAALPDLEGPRMRLTPIQGTVSAPDALPPGCAFAPRCLMAGAACRRAIPALTQVSDLAHSVACFRNDAFTATAVAEQARQLSRIPA
ncbi:ABC transporter ATP-binding protein [Taklimakanibacter lacteus]|uniref:ABC transporter ATP-binding protein n=1 Tax=Taklimakanibacter lacteus TaxID=2268456 RepID=UPI000E663092